ncbi:MAG TPA: Lrp/AsnC family transcriptional regulator [Flexivirga sp.]|uniref:Lrp/AsnC family transcriptional regulator n=1 Tax=Flexivirga sp. TaxID=1962927 RepID=UPI002C8282D9|nr:Lrp/AsnC family transcriptional regulator [Flexivirga sp.]HWC24540.1 Lrp/AsnC family transcriptional regulator [Flexivirga sp.]
MATDRDLVSEDDLALINALQIAPRARWTDLAEVLDTHPTSLAARWDRLRASGMAWVTGHLVGDPQDMSLCFLEVDCDIQRRASVSDELGRIPQVVTVEHSASDRTLLLTITTQSFQDLSEVVIERIAALPGVIDYRSAVCTRLHQGGYAWRLGVLNAAHRAQVQQLAHSAGASARLPDSHLALLPLLAANGRVTAAEMARTLHRTPATVQRQLSKVISSNVLSFRCEIAQRYSGFPVSCQWYVRVPADAHSKAAQALAAMPQVRLAASTTGEANFVIVMWLRSVAEVMDVEVALAQQIPEIELLRNTLILRATKRVGWLLNPDTTGKGPAEHTLSVTDFAR